jgi:23S rRNA (uracil1939-C5)-methyltransferase
MRYIAAVFKPARHRFTIASLDEDGAGVGAPPGLGGRHLHVPFCLPGEEVVAEIAHQSPHRPEAWGRLIERFTSAPARTEPACRAWGRCGGCALQHLAYPSQLTFKRALLEDALRAAGLAAPVGECLAPGPPRPYRNRAKLVFSRAGDRVILGAYAPRSHRVIDLHGCRVVIPPLDDIAAVLARLATDLGVQPYDERTATGQARYAILRAARDGRTQVMLVCAERGGRGITALAAALCRERPEVVGVVENLQPSPGNALVGHIEPDRLLVGDPVLVERCGPTLRLSPRAFFQASWHGAEALYAAAVTAAAPVAGDAIVDLYTGVGGIALSLARAAPAASVLGIEEEPAAIADAEAGAVLSGIANARFRCGDAAALLGERADRAEATDVVVVDPPRRGLTPPVIAAIARLRPRRVVYVSCAPDTLARDLALLTARGYHIERVDPVDLMPDTPHVEAIAALSCS